MKKIILILFTFLCAKINADNGVIVYWDSCNTITEVSVIEFKNLEKERPLPILKRLREKQFNRQKLTAALLAFPFPFGIVGLHRIYLGTKPYVPVAYIASLGGIFGILPLVDFFVILFDKDFDSYKNNDKVLMWVK